MTSGGAEKWRRWESNPRDVPPEKLDQTRRNLEVLADALAAPGNRQLRLDVESPGSHEPESCEWCRRRPIERTAWIGGIHLKVCGNCAAIAGEER